MLGFLTPANIFKSMSSLSKKYLSIISKILNKISDEEETKIIRLCKDNCRLI